MNKYILLLVVTSALFSMPALGGEDCTMWRFTIEAVNSDHEERFEVVDEICGNTSAKHRHKVQSEIPMPSKTEPEIGIRFDTRGKSPALLDFEVWAKLPEKNNFNESLPAFTSLSATSSVILETGQKALIKSDNGRLKLTVEEITN